MASNKVIIKNEYDMKINKNFYKYSLVKNSSFTILLFITGVLCLVMLLMNGSINDDSPSSIILWSIALLGIIFMPLMTIMNTKKQTKKDYLKRKDIIETYEITKEKIQRTSNEGTPKIAVNWIIISNVVEVDDAFYFFTVHNESFTINKTGFIEGDYLDLRRLITNNLTKTKKGKLPFVIKEKEYVLNKKLEKKAGKK